MSVLLEELGKDGVTRQVDPVGEQLAAEAEFLLVSAVGQFEEDRVEVAFVDAGGVPDGVEVAGFIFRCDEASVQPDLGASSSGEQRQRVGESIKLGLTGLVPSESFEDLGPRRVVFAWGQIARLGEERRDRHRTTISLCWFFSVRVGYPVHLFGRWTAARARAAATAIARSAKSSRLANGTAGQFHPPLDEWFGVDAGTLGTCSVRSQWPPEAS
jgi:hypothetical protein